MIRRTNKMAYATEYRNMMLHLLDHLYRNRSRYVAASIFCAAVLTNVMSAVLTHHNARRRLAHRMEQRYDQFDCPIKEEYPVLEGLEVENPEDFIIKDLRRVELHSMKDPTLNGRTAVVKWKKARCSCCNGRPGCRCGGNCRDCHGKGFVRGDLWTCRCGCGCYEIKHLRPILERSELNKFLIAPANLKPRERRSGPTPAAAIQAAHSPEEDAGWFFDPELEKMLASKLEPYDHAAGEKATQALLDHTLPKIRGMQTNLETTQFGNDGKVLKQLDDDLRDAQVENDHELSLYPDTENSSSDTYQQGNDLENDGPTNL